jgi:endonuclease III
MYIDMERFIVINTFLFNIAMVIIFSIIYTYISPNNFVPLNPKDQLTYIDFLFYAVTIQSGIGLPDITEAAWTLLTQVPVNQILLNKIRNLIKSIGLFNNKAKNIYFLSKILLKKYQGKVPNKFEDLISLPGVGRKTANVVLNAAFNKPTIAVDTHVFRVGNRTGLSNGKNPAQVENQLLKVLSNKHLKKAHHLILLHGRYVCKARKPDCKKCIINKICLYKYKS